VPARSGHFGVTRDGYIELPYTLPQDFNLFVVLRERTDRIWKQKLEWIVERGGMALMNTHPDYMHFGQSERCDEFAADRYLNFLAYVKETYAGAFWHALPREVASFANANCMTFDQRPLIASQIRKL
jgi:hypothetical protein